MDTVAMATEQVHHTVPVAMDPATCQFQYMDMEVLVLVSEDRDSVSLFLRFHCYIFYSDCTVLNQLFSND